MTSIMRNFIPQYYLYMIQIKLKYYANTHFRMFVLSEQ